MTGGAVITPELLRRALRLVGRPAPSGGGRYKVAFIGGEHLEDIGLLLRLLAAVRETAPGAETEVVSGADMLTPGAVRRLAAAGCEICARFDLRGGRAGNLKLPAPLAAALSDKSLSRRIHAAALMDSRSITRLPEAAARLGEAAGFKQLEIALDAAEYWSPAALSRLRKVLGELRSAAPAVLSSRGVPAAFLFSGFGGAPPDEEPGRALALLPDGRFYLSDLVSFPLSPRFAAGDAGRGPHPSRLARLSALVRRLNSRYGSGPVPPSEKYAAGVSRGARGASLRAMLDNAAAVNRVFREEAAPLALLMDIFGRLRKEPGFGDLAHPPKYKAPVRMDFMKIRCGGQPPASLRSRVDFFLRAPGDVKRLFLEYGDPDSVWMAAYFMAAAARIRRRGFVSMLAQGRCSR
ncbi:MAG: hypothetical protein RQ748_02340 [Elusimicrobiales bacterium]|nr:hypothetical protein [Elusimicrobiales bacterium]